MNRRQQKKRLKKALDVLNKIEVVDSDSTSEDVLYIRIADSHHNIEILKRHCGLLGIDKHQFIEVLRQPLEDEENEAYLDLSLSWVLWHEPRCCAIFHSSKDGFVVKRYIEDI